MDKKYSVISVVLLALLSTQLAGAYVTTQSLTETDSGFEKTLTISVADGAMTEFDSAFVGSTTETNAKTVHINYEIRNLGSTTKSLCFSIAVGCSQPCSLTLENTGSARTAYTETGYQKFYYHLSDVDVGRPPGDNFPNDERCYAFIGPGMTRTISFDIPLSKISLDPESRSIDIFDAASYIVDCSDPDKYPLSGDTCMTLLTRSSSRTSKISVGIELACFTDNDCDYNEWCSPFSNCLPRVCDEGYRLENHQCISNSGYCGDGACNGAETCSTCSSDCGSCYITPPAQPVAQPQATQPMTTVSGDNTGLLVLLVIAAGVVVSILLYLTYGSGKKPTKSSASGRRIVTSSPQAQAKTKDEDLSLFCGKCGAKLKPGNDFCIKCGTKMK